MSPMWDKYRHPILMEIEEKENPIFPRHVDSRGHCSAVDIMLHIGLMNRAMILILVL